MPTAAPIRRLRRARALAPASNLSAATTTGRGIARESRAIPASNLSAATTTGRGIARESRAIPASNLSAATTTAAHRAHPSTLAAPASGGWSVESLLTGPIRQPWPRRRRVAGRSNPCSPGPSVNLGRVATEYRGRLHSNSPVARQTRRSGNRVPRTPALEFPGGPSNSAQWQPSTADACTRNQMSLCPRAQFGSGCPSPQLCGPDEPLSSGAIRLGLPEPAAVRTR